MISVGLIQVGGVFLILVAKDAFILKEVPKLVILATIIIDGILYASWNRDMVICIDDFLAAFDDPGEDRAASIVVEILAVILDVAAVGDLGIKRNDDESPSDTIIGCTDTRQVVGIEHQRVAGLEGKWILIFLLCKDIIGRAELLDGRVIKPCTFLHLCSNEKSLPLDLGHFRFDVSATTYGQGIRRNVPGVKVQHTGDGIPEGGFTIATITISDDQSFHINLADGSKPANHLDVIDELLIVLEDQIQAVQPNLHAFLVW